MEEIYVEDERAVDAPKPVRLRFAPIEHSGKTYDSLVLREPTVGDLLAMRKKADPIEQMAALIGCVSGLSPFVVHQLPQGVLEAASAYFEGFQKPTATTGSA